MIERFLAALGRLLNPFGNAWKGMSAQQRVLLVLSGLLVFGGIWGFREWMVQKAYRPLYSELSAEEAGAAVSRLQELQVPYKLTAAGSTILVPESRLAEVRLQLASDGLPRRGRLGFELFDESHFGATEFAEHVNFRRALEGELERSIVSLREVSRARVHISLPKRSVFLDYEQPAKASVVVQLRGAAQLEREKINAIAYLVASAVEGLDPGRVVVVDTTGRVLAKPRAGSDDISGDQLGHQRQLATEIERKILVTLEPYIGIDRARASVAVECEWNAGEQTEEVIDPNTVVMTTQKSEEIAAPPSGNGVPGTASNLPRQPLRAGIGGMANSRITETTNYQTSRTVTRMKLEPGEIRRVSVAVLVDHHVKMDETATKLVRTPRTDEEMEVIRQLVTAAAGIVEERGDRLTIESLPFTIFEPPPEVPEVTEVAPPIFSMEWLESYRYYLIGAVVSVVLVLLALAGFVRFRKKLRQIKAEHEAALATEATKKEIEAADAAAHRQELEEARILQGLKMETLQSSKAQVLKKHLEETADKDPEGFVQLLRSWIHEDD